MTWALKTWLVRLEVGTNLVGEMAISLQNMQEVSELCGSQGMHGCAFG